MTKKQATKAERSYMGRVAALGCIICERPAQVHHVRKGVGKGQRASHFDVIPLCPYHHTDGGLGMAIHAGRTTWERCFGTEAKLLKQTKEKLGVI